MWERARLTRVCCAQLHGFETERSSCCTLSAPCTWETDGADKWRSLAASKRLARATSRRLSARSWKRSACTSTTRTFMRVYGARSRALSLSRALAHASAIDRSKFLYIGRLDDERVFGVRGEPLLAVCSFGMCGSRVDAITSQCRSPIYTHSLARSFGAAIIVQCTCNSSRKHPCCASIRARWPISDGCRCSTLSTPSTRPSSRTFATRCATTRRPSGTCSTSRP